MENLKKKYTKTSRNLQYEGKNTLIFPRPLGASLVAHVVKNLPAMQETWVQSLGQKDTLEKGMANHSRILAWRTPRTEDPGGYSPQSCKEST